MSDGMSRLKNMRQSMVERGSPASLIAKIDQLIRDRCVIEGIGETNLLTLPELKRNENY